MKKSSIVWKFFDRVKEKGHCTTVICKLCESEYKFFGNTTNMRVHLSKKHPMQWQLANNSGELGISSEPISTLSSKPPKRFAKVVEDSSESEQEDDSAARKLMEELDKDTTNEEWLEIPYDVITEQPKRELKRKIKQEYDESSVRHNSFYVPTKLRSNFEIENRNKDEYFTFGEYIANKLRKVKSARTRGNIQQIITTVLWQAESGAYDNPDSVKNLFFANITPVVNTTVIESTYNNEDVLDNSVDTEETQIETLQ